MFKVYERKEEHVNSLNLELCPLLHQNSKYFFSQTEIHQYFYVFFFMRMQI